MPVTGSSVSVTTTATRLGVPRWSRTDIIVNVPAEGRAIYVGGSSVTTTTGFRLGPGERVTISNSDSSRSGSEGWHAVTDTGSQSVAVVEVSAQLGINGDNIGISSDRMREIVAAGLNSRFSTSGVVLGWCADLGWGQEMIARSIVEAKAIGMNWVRYDGRKDGTSGIYSKMFDDSGVNQIIMLYSGWQSDSVDDYIVHAGEIAETHYVTGARTFEIANEPNTSGQISTSYETAASVYAEMVVGAAAEIRRRLPEDEITILAGSLSRNNSVGWNFYDFTELLYENGIAGSFDAYSVHPYTMPELPSTIASATADWHRMPLVYDLMVANGDTGKKIWATEFSTPTADNVHATSEDVAGAIIDEALKTWVNYPWSGPMMHYLLRDNQPGSSETFGVFKYDWTPKAPVLLGIRNFTETGVGGAAL